MTARLILLAAITLFVGAFLLGVGEMFGRDFARWILPGSC